MKELDAYSKLTNEEKKETLEEAVLNSNEHDNLKSEDGTYLSFHKQSELLLKGAEIGAKWQAERMYSEEKVKQIIDKTLIEYSDFVLADIPHLYALDDKYTIHHWFEQFKKK